MDDFTADFREMDRLVADMALLGPKTLMGTIEVVTRTTEAVERDARSFAPRTGLPHYAETITSEVQVDPRGVVGEVGPEKGGQGSLGHILEFGTVDTGPQAHVLPAADRHDHEFVHGLARLKGSDL